MKNNDLISRSALLEEYDRAHVGPPGGARKLIEEAEGASIDAMIDYFAATDPINELIYAINRKRNKDDTMIILENCPCCGSPATLREYSADIFEKTYYVYAVECMVCGLRTDRMGSQKMVADTWNCRVPSVFWDISQDAETEKCEACAITYSWERGSANVMGETNDADD